MTALRGDHLADAIEGHARLMATIRANQSLGVPDLAAMLYPHELSAALAYSPTSLEDAIGRYKKAEGENEGEDVYTLIAFLHAHRWLLQTAAASSLGVVHAVWIY